MHDRELLSSQPPELVTWRVMVLHGIRQYIAKPIASLTRGGRCR